MPPDPMRTFGSFFGGSNPDDVSSMVLDEVGNIYVCGITQSVDLPTTNESHQQYFSGGPGVTDGFIAKISNTNELMWCTYFGGSGPDYINDIAYMNGKFYITGRTGSSSNIALSGSYDTDISGPVNCFITCFDSEGICNWSTYYGGNGYDSGRSIVATVEDEIYVGGRTSSASGIATTGAYKTQLDGSEDGFLLKMSSLGIPIWCTYFGGDNGDGFASLDLDEVGNVYITGSTQSTEGIAFGNAMVNEFQGLADCFISAFSSGGELLWGTYYGGDQGDEPFEIKCFGNMLSVTGTTSSLDGIAMAADAYQDTYGGGLTDGFLLEINVAGDFLYSTYLGGAGQENFFSIETQEGMTILGAQSSSTNLATAGAYQTSLDGIYDALIMAFDEDHQLFYSTYYGGVNSEFGMDVLQHDGKLYLLGESSSLDGMVTPDAFQSDNAGFGDAFIAVFSELVGINEKTKYPIQIYPNPCSDFIQVNSKEKIKQLELFDMAGMLVSRQTLAQMNTCLIDISHIAGGAYVIKTSTESEIHSSKVFVVK